MELIEITGQPCSGKTNFIDRETKSNNLIKKYNQRRNLADFFIGIYYLGYSRSKTLFFWSLKEDVPFLFKLNIFRNAVIKFSIFISNHKLDKYKNAKLYVDEGISHLPFMFLKMDTLKVLKFIAKELLKTKVIFLKSPSQTVIKERLQRRGHKRLRYLSLNLFVERNMEIEEFLLKQYPKLCKDLRLKENVINV